MKDAVTWHRDMVTGGHAESRWGEGVLQLELLKDAGLQPHHRLLDIGCGCFRLGIHAIPYLNVGNYIGVDLRMDILEAGVTQELEPRGLMSRSPKIIRSSSFGRGQLARGLINYAWAYSLFTHLRPRCIEACLEAVAYALAPGGKFIASYNRADTPEQVSQGTRHPEYDHYQMCVYSEDLMKGAAASSDLQVEPLDARCSMTYEGRDNLQRMLLFTRA
jgi:SAM-dependent methyltransferase